MTLNIDEVDPEVDPRETIRRMYVDGKLDANAATLQLLTLDSQRRATRGVVNDGAPAAGGT